MVLAPTLFALMCAAHTSLPALMSRQTSRLPLTNALTLAMFSWLRAYSGPAFHYMLRGWLTRVPAEVATPLAS